MPDYLSDSRMAKYAKLILEEGLGFKKGMKIFIQVEPDNYYLARFLAKYAYSLGAQYVHIELDDLDLLSHRLDVQSERELKFYPDGAESNIAQVVNEGWGVVLIRCTETSLNIKNFEKFESYNRTKKRFMYPLSKAKSDMQLPWCIVCMPSEKWAERFRLYNGSEKVLWDLMSHQLFLDSGDAIDKYRKVSSYLSDKADLLNQMRLSSVNLSSQACRLNMSFDDSAVWCTGKKHLPDGRSFSANIPSFEVYTSPICTSVEGEVRLTRPLCLPSGIVEGAEFCFSSGKLVKTKSHKGQEALDAFLSLDKTACFVGELGLVESEENSCKSEVFLDTLWDENAGTHIALGSSHPDCFKKDIKNINGFNNSIVHADCIIGSADMDVEGMTRDGVSVQIMRNGRFVI